MSPVSWGDIFTLLLGGDRIMELRQDFLSRLTARPFLAINTRSRWVCTSQEGVSFAASAPVLWPRPQFPHLTVSRWPGVLPSRERSNLADQSFSTETRTPTVLL